MIFLCFFFASFPDSAFCLAPLTRPRSMSFLNFRAARRRAKKIVSLRNRALRPPTPDSFFSGEPPRVDVDINHRPLLASDIIGISDFRLATSSSDFQDDVLVLTGPSVRFSRSLPDDVGGLRKARVLALVHFDN